MIKSVNDTNVWLSGIHWPYGAGQQILHDWYWVLIAGSTFVTPRHSPSVVTNDPDDDKFIACALEGQADYVVSEDKDLRRLGQYCSLQIVGKQSFLRILEAAPLDKESRGA
jgi:predicted nucleic acid-binding protein